MISKVGELISYLENMTNFKNDGVGINQLCRVDQRSPSLGIGGRAETFSGSPYIVLNASSKRDL